MTDRAPLPTMPPRNSSNDTGYPELCYDLLDMFKFPAFEVLVTFQVSTRSILFLNLYFKCCRYKCVKILLGFYDPVVVTNAVLVPAISSHKSSLCISTNSGTINVAFATFGNTNPLDAKEFTSEAFPTMNGTLNVTLTTDIVEVHRI